MRKRGQRALHRSRTSCAKSSCSHLLAPPLQTQEVLPQRGHRLRPSSSVGLPGSKMPIMAPLARPLGKPGLQGKLGWGPQTQEVPPQRGHGLRPTIRRRFARGSKMAMMAPPRGPPETAFMQGKVRGVSDSRPLVSGMDSSALANARSTAATGAWPSPTHHPASVCQGVQDGDDGPSPRFLEKAGLQGKARGVCDFKSFGGRDGLVCLCRVVRQRTQEGPALRRPVLVLRPVTKPAA